MSGIMIWQSTSAFDMEVDGEPVKALAQASKNSWLYILNRETGEPVHPIIETPVSTQTDIEGEEPWQPNPFPIRKMGANGAGFSSLPYRHTCTAHGAKRVSGAIYTNRSQSGFRAGFGGGQTMGSLPTAKILVISMLML